MKKFIDFMSQKNEGVHPGDVGQGYFPASGMGYIPKAEKQLTALNAGLKVKIDDLMKSMFWNERLSPAQRKQLFDALTKAIDDTVANFSQSVN